MQLAVDPRDINSNAAMPPSDSARGSIRAGLIVLALFFGGFGSWAITAPLNAAVVGEAVVKVQGNRKSVQQLDGGIVTELRVHEGDHVEEGDVLMLLDSTQARAEYDILIQQQFVLLATESRLLAERDGADRITFAKALEEHASDSRAQQAQEGQQSEFSSRRAALIGETEILQRRRSQLEDQIEASEQLLVTQQNQLDSITEEQATLKDLFERGLVTRQRVLELERTATGIEGQIATTAGNIAGGKESIGEVDRQIEQLQHDRLSDVTKQLGEVQAKLQDLVPRLANADAVVSRTEVRAPYAGEVVDLAVFAVGAVIGRGERLLDIVPENASLVVEAKIKVEDIADIAPGMRSEVHFTSYKQRVTPLIHGKVAAVSADRLTDPRTEIPYYIAQVEVDAAELAASPEIQLYPGMPATVMITTQQRTALDYLVGPLMASFDRSFKEK